MAELPEPIYVDPLDPAAVLAACVADFEARYGKPLDPAQVERIFVDFVANRESLLRQQIQDAAKQNLWRFSRYPMLDFLAEVLGVTRLPAVSAITAFAWTIPVQLVDTTIPEGSLVRSKDGKAIFATDQELVIVAGQTSGSVGATCTVAGLLGNGYVPGQVTDLVGSFPIAVTVTNTTTTSKGAASENTEALRVRGPQAAKARAVAGPGVGYSGLALSAHPDVLDVDIATPVPGTVLVTILVRAGADESAVTDAVEDAVEAGKDPNDIEDRPVTDTVQVAVAGPVDYALVADFTLLKGAKWSEVQPAALAAWNAYDLEHRTRLGTAPIESQVYKALSVAGVHKVVLTSPSGLVVDADEWARCTAVTLNYAGTES